MKSIPTFEYSVLKIDEGDYRLEPHQLKALQEYYYKGTEYFTLIKNGIRFSNYVGVLQIGDLTIEILPKADKFTDDSISSWRDVLLKMLKTVGLFNVEAPSSSNLSLKSNSILDLYFELFLSEVEKIIRQGPIKKYVKEEKNLNKAKGKIIFSRNINRNLIHKERFYCLYNIYEFDNLYNQILFQALSLVREINTSCTLTQRICSVLNNFPEVSNLKITEDLFLKIKYSRKNEHYKNALEIAKLLLLKYHPDVLNGKNHVLAILFDMNVLWEKFVYKTLQKKLGSKEGFLITEQVSKDFWERDGRRSVKIRPDLFISKNGTSVILDTKWKNLLNDTISTDDLRQMYVYHEYFKASKVGLVFPGNGNIISGKYSAIENRVDFDKECSLIPIDVSFDMDQWQVAIADKIKCWIEKS